MEQEIKKIGEGIDSLKTSIDAVKQENSELKNAVVTLDETTKKNQGVIDEVSIFLAEQKKQANETRSKSFREQLGESLKAKANDLKNYNEIRKTGIALDLKAVGNMGASNFTISGTQNFQNPQMLGGVGRTPYEAAHVRDIPGVTSQAISGTSDVYVIRDAAGEGGPTAVSPAAAKPQSDRDYVKLVVPITKIAHYFKIPEENLNDIDWLQSEISTIGVEELYAKEDNLFLNQVGGAGLFAGLTTATNSTAFAAPSSLALLVPTPNNYDALIAAWTQLRNLKSTANAVLVNPSDYAAMVLAKSTTGEYVFGAPNVQIPNVFGVPVIAHTAIAAGKFLMGDYSKIRIAQRAGVSVRFYDQNEDDAIKNMVTVVIEERAAIVADRADRLIYGDFAAAKTALTKP